MNQELIPWLWNECSHGVILPWLLQLLCKQVLKDNPVPVTVWQIRQTMGTRKAPLLVKDGYCSACQEQRNLGCSRNVLHASWFQECDTFWTVYVRTSYFDTFDFWDCLTVGNPRSAAPFHTDFCTQQLSCLIGYWNKMKGLECFLGKMGRWN